MPTYTSTRTSNVRVKGPTRYYTIVPGENELAFYLQTLPSLVTLTDHAPQVNPFVLVDAVTSFPSDDLNVSAYETIVVSNKTDAVAVIYANDDDGNTLDIPVGSVLCITNGQHWGLLTIASAGTGTVNVVGIVDDSSTPNLRYS